MVDGGITVFGDNAEGTENQLLWVDEEIQEELQQAMDSGELEQQVQKGQPDILAIRYIPPGTPLPNPSNPGGVDNDSIGGSRTNVVSWALIGLGVLLMTSVVIYMTIIRRRYKREEEEHNAAVAGAFPSAVTQQNIAQIRLSHRGESDRKDSSNNIYHEISKRYSNSSEVLPGNRSISDGGSSMGDEDPLLIFHDGASPRHLPEGISTSWRDQIIRDDHHESASSLDPNRPFVRPVPQDDHSQSSYSQQYHSVASEGYDSSYAAGSSRTGSSHHSRASPSSRTSPSKLTVAFERSEIT